MAEAERKYDVAVAGGGLSGAATALLLKRADPSLRILLAEARTRADRKVGESAIELASWFLTRVLGLDRHLTLEHLPKYGLRFWFHDASTRSLDDASELGNAFQARVPSYHIERGLLDDHVLGLAETAGVEVRRGTRLTVLSLGSDGGSLLDAEGPGGAARLRCRWLVDATGRRAMLGRKLGLLEPIAGHPTRSVWARYRNVADIDTLDLPVRSEGGPGVPACSRGLSTNHLMGLGWWIWLIPLPGGDTSVGLVWDSRLFDLPGAGSLAARFDAFLKSTPAGRDLLGGASMLDHDLHALKDLAYKVTRIAGPGWALVGDAAGFLDPLYSPGLDWAAATVMRTVEMLVGELKQAGSGKVERHDALFTRSFGRWMEALYRDKYYYMGDIDLMELALRIDVSLYYFGVIGPLYREGARGVDPPFGPAISTPFYHLIRLANRRLARLARLRLEAGTWGRRNRMRHVLLPGFTPGPRALTYLPGALARWARLEIGALPDRLKALARRARPGSAGLRDQENVALDLLGDPRVAADDPREVLPLDEAQDLLRQ